MELIKFLVEKGYTIEQSIKTRKGRGKTQITCSIDKKPTEEEISEYEKIAKVKVLKCNFKKGKELSVLIKQDEQDEVDSEQKSNIEIQDMNLDTITDLLYGKEMSREKMRNLLNIFQSSSYTKGFNAHKNAMKKFLS